MNHTMNFLRPYLRGWPIVLLSMALAYWAAAKYLSYATPMYEGTVKLRLADVQEGVPNANLFKDLDVFASTQKINAEIEMLKSYALLSKALKTLPFELELYRVGQLRKQELFHDSPIKLVPIRWPDALMGKAFGIEVEGNRSFRLTDGRGGVWAAQLGDTLDLGQGRLVVGLNEDFLAGREATQVNGQYEFRLNTPQATVAAVAKNLEVASVDKDVAVIRITYRSAQPEKAALLPNALAEAYIADYIEAKYSAANLTLGFLNERIKEIGSKLSDSESAILNYRNKHSITNIRQETETELRKIAQLKIQQTNLKMSLDAIRELERYVIQGQDNFLELAPNFEAFTDLLSTEIIKQIKHLQAEKRDLRLQYTDGHERVRVVDAKVRDLTDYLVESIRNTRKNLATKYAKLSTDIETAELVFIDVPEKEKAMTILNREFEIYQQSYNFLNDKKIEAEIAKAAKVAFHRVITPAFKSETPVSPNRIVIKIVAIILGMVGALLLIFIVHTLKGKVNSPHLITMSSSVPIAAQVPKLRNAAQAEAFFFKALSQWEVKGLLKPGWLVSFTGFRLSEGMKYLAGQVLHSLASQGRSVLLVDFHASLFPSVPPQFSPVRYSDGIWVMNLPVAELQACTVRELQTLIGVQVKRFEQTVVLNQEVSEQFCLPVMAMADFNLLAVDTRMTPAKKIAEADLMQAEYALPGLHFIVNRTGYSPNFLVELLQFARRAFRQPKRLSL